jgi:hypothetical protein
MKDEPVVLLLLRSLSPEWAITRDESGFWRAARPVRLCDPSLDGLLGMLADADPLAARHAASVLSESSRRSAASAHGLRATPP